MPATVQDRRSPEERLTHTVIVQGVDIPMSGWGLATGGTSVAAWACLPSDRDRVEAWVRNRRDLERVTVTEGIRVPAGCAHYSLYVVHTEHTALSGG